MVNAPIKKVIKTTKTSDGDIISQTTTIVGSNNQGKPIKRYSIINNNNNNNNKNNFVTSLFNSVPTTTTTTTTTIVNNIPTTTTVVNTKPTTSTTVYTKPTTSTVVYTKPTTTTVVNTKPTTTTIVNNAGKNGRRYKINVNNNENKNKLTEFVHNQIKKQEVWNKDLEKFYNDRDGDDFERSDCTGRKKAVYVGINYIGQKSELKGCINDVRNISQLFSKKYGFTQAVILTDDNPDDSKKPTYDNIISAMKWLVSDAKEDDSLIFHFSGHGGTVKDADGDEMDGFDESIMPCDYLTNGQIVDDEIYDILVAPLPKGCKLTAIFDSCHSGTIMDLPYTYQCQNKIEVIENDVRKEIFKKTNNVVNSLISGNPTAISNSFKGVFDGSLKRAAQNGTRPETLQRRKCAGEVLQFSGCKDNQTSADMTVGNVSTGALSYAIMTLLSEDKEYNYTELLASIRRVLAEKKFTQIPQLSTSRPLNMNEKFYV